MTAEKESHTLTVPGPVYEFLTAAARRAKTDATTILAEVVAVVSVTERTEAAPWLENMGTPAREALEELDRLLRIANPGSQLVFRPEYIGYRRFDTRKPDGVTASRTQIYASVLPRQRSVRLVLPVNPDDFLHIDGVSDLRGKGHHGIGNVAVNVLDADHACRIVEAFDSWLGPASRHPGRHS